MFEMRWVVPSGTTTQPARLQYRYFHHYVGEDEIHTIASDWIDVPTVVED